MVEFECPICDSSDFTPSNCFNHIELLTCASCGLVRTKKIPSKEEIDKMYLEGYYSNFNKRFINLFEYLVKYFRKRRASFIHNISNKGIILDIGCGRAFMLDYLRSFGWNTYGTTLSPEMGQNIENSQNHKMFVGDLVELDLPVNYFDVVTLWHVFEHLVEPKNYLNIIHDLLKVDGLLVIEVPNIMSTGYKVFKQFWFPLDYPRHIYHYNAKNISIFLRNQGFNIKDVRYFSLEYDFFGFFQSFLNKFLNNKNGFFNSLTYSYASNRWLKIILYLLIFFVSFPLLVLVNFAIYVSKKSDTIRIIASKSKQ
jgi:SAM-dependent methyltransferase